MANRGLTVDRNPTAYVRNGAVGTVINVELSDRPERESVTVDFDDIGPIRLPRSFFDEHEAPSGQRDVGIDHAYAVTSYAVQGATFDVSTSRIDQAATRSEAYVDITRGREANHLFLARSPSSLDGEQLPKAPDPELEQVVAERLRQSGPERVAIEFDTLDGVAAQARLLAYDPPNSWTGRHPTPSLGPVHLRRRYDEALRSVLEYRLHHQPRPGGGDPWEWALGSPGDKTSLEARCHALLSLDRYARSVAAEELAKLDIKDEGVLENLRYAVSAGAPRCDLQPLAVDATAPRRDAALRKPSGPRMPNDVAVGTYPPRAALHRLANPLER